MANLKEVLRIWEEENKTPLGRAVDVNLSFRFPPLQKLDASISLLVSCEKLSLSTNQIDKIVGFQKLKNLRILSIGRNNLKDLSGLEAVADTLEQLWMSYNPIDKLKGINVFTKLSTLYMTYNNIKDWTEFMRLAELPQLKELNFLGNPLVENIEEEKYRAEVAKRLPNLKILDGMSVIRE